MIQNTKGETAFDLVFIIIVFFLLLGGGLAYVINTMIGVSLENNQFSPFESFFIYNFLIIVIFIFVVAVMWRSR